MPPLPSAAPPTRRAFLATALGGAVALPAPAAPGAPSAPAALAAESPQPRRWPAGRATPALRLPGWDGGPPLDLAALRGRVVLLNFWASWCEPCRAEMPSLELLAEKYERRGLAVWALNFRETDGALRRYLAQWPITLPIARDGDGAAAQAFGVRVFPSSIAVARDGRAAFVVTGEVDWTAREPQRWIEALL